MTFRTTRYTVFPSVNLLPLRVIGSPFSVMGSFGDVADQLDRLGLCIYDCGYRVRRDHKLRQEAFVELLHPLEQITELLLFRTLRYFNSVSSASYFSFAALIDSSSSSAAFETLGSLAMAAFTSSTASKPASFSQRSVSFFARTSSTLESLQSIHCLLGLYDVLTIILAVS